MKKALLVLAFLLPALAQAGEKVFFDTDKSDLTFVEKEKVITLAQKAKESGAKIVIVGNADKRGSRLYNLDLGMRRASAVFELLAAQGVPEDQLAISLSYGEEKPLAPADSIKEHLATNRRVDILLVEAKVKTIVVNTPVEVVREVPTYRKNRVTLLGGAGPQGLSKDTLGTNHYAVSQDYTAVGGLGYSRSLNDRWSIGATAFTNASFFLNVGFDF
jgi:hypothetical protein